MPTATARRLPVAIVLALALGLAALVSLAACDISRVVSGTRGWTQSSELVGGGTYTIDVQDTSGRIDAVEFDPADAGAVPGVVNPPGSPNVLLVPWTGGACDERTEISIAGAGAGLAVTIRTTTRPGDCEAIGVGHVIRLRSTQPLPAAQVRVTVEP